ncbi:MAG: TetR/AcrR family transcriptional regulator [Anaerolineae bacterium]|nr:MAG: TetR/AcrR family transcriptional regulator [Anaerolineae bacterium]
MSNNLRVDPRVIRTRALLGNALVECVAESGFESLTIQEITARATLNRATFYLHYRDKNELLEDVFERLIGAAIPPPPAEGISIDPREPICAMLEHVSQYAEFYRAILGEQGVPFFMKRMRTKISPIIGAWLSRAPGMTSPAGDPPEVIITYITSAYLGVISWWLENDRPLSSDEMVEELLTITSGGVLAYLEKQKTG